MMETAVAASSGGRSPAVAGFAILCRSIPVASSEIFREQAD